MIETSSGCLPLSLSPRDLRGTLPEPEVTRLPAPSASLFPVEESGEDVRVSEPGCENRAASFRQGALRRRGRGLCAVEATRRPPGPTHPDLGLGRVPVAASGLRWRGEEGAWGDESRVACTQLGDTGDRGSHRSAPNLVPLVKNTSRVRPDPLCEFKCVECFQS